MGCLYLLSLSECWLYPEVSSIVLGSALRVSMALWATKLILEMCIRRELKGHDHAVVVIIYTCFMELGLRLTLFSSLGLLT